jgi:hypothetical protein
LKRLNASIRNSMLRDSPRLKRRERRASTLTIFGWRKALRPSGRKKLLPPEPVTLALSAAASGRPLMPAENVLPDCAVKMGAMVQPPKMARPTLDSSRPKPFGFQTALATKRCGTSKFDTPPSSSRL